MFMLVEIQRRCLRPTVWMVVVFCALWSVAAAPPADEAAKIQSLLGAIETSGVKFIRNGIEYDGPAARSHMELKLSRAGGRIKTADHFIRYLATKSSMTGIPYYVKLPGGRKIPAADWLRARLKQLERR